MKRPSFGCILLAVTLILSLLTAAHALYIVRAYENASVIQFIAREMW